jgi:Fic family protein
MIYQPPQLHDNDLAVLEIISEQRDRLKVYTQNSPKRWHGSLRRSTFARAIQGSNSIEGYHASIDDAIAAVEDEPPSDDRTETWLAIKGYRDALTYINQASMDRYFEFSKQFLKSLHFMMIGFDMPKYPGQWRPGSIWVVNERTGKTVYNGPPAEEVNELAEELVNYLRSPLNGEPVIVRAAMAHLNLTMIHPFKDGNGRMARALQTFVLAREGILHPVFSSIEEWLGRNTDEYYSMLAETGQGVWNPTRDALPWIRFCLKAHFQQAATLIRRNEEYSLLYDRLTILARERGLPERSLLLLFDAALGFRLTNSRYRNDAEVSEVVASRDLRRLSELRLLQPIGENPGFECDAQAHDEHDGRYALYPRTLSFRGS